VDIDHAVARVIAESTFPDREEALTTFAPRDGR